MEKVTLSKAALELYKLIAESKGVVLTDICEGLGKGKPAVLKAISRLNKKGLIAKELGDNGVVYSVTDVVVDNYEKPNKEF